jgi:fermentation-respiration switch protein FrsA (DUF1100 family)
MRSMWITSLVGLLLPGLQAAGEEAAPQEEGGIRMPPAEVIGEITKRLLDDPDGRMTDLGKRLLGENGADMLFYFPTRDEPRTPRDLGLNYEDVEFRSGDGTRLHGWFVPAKGARAKATVVFSHGNTGSVGHHLPFVSWLPAEGYHVFLYDYRGYGKSGGRIERAGLVEDAGAAFRAAAARDDVDASKLLSLSHSLGGAKSTAALAARRPAGLRGVAVMSSFASYRAMARTWGGNVGAGLTDDELAPVELIGKLEGVPVLLMHGDADEVIPFDEGRVLAAAAREPKQFWQVPRGRHNDLLTIDGGKWRTRLVAWMDARVGARAGGPWD